jgi:hypothetical protein
LVNDFQGQVNDERTQRFEKWWHVIIE